MARAFLVVMDSVGVGGAPDAGRFFNGKVPDTGANTFGHIVRACARGEAEDGRSGPLDVPVMADLGMGRAVALASGLTLPGFDRDVAGAWGAATEVSPGKDTPSGHWELAGVPVPWDWAYFPDSAPCFPDDLVADICAAAGTTGILGNRHASGTNIIEEEGARHLKTGWPICYTSVDSVLQIAAHEEAFGLDRLLDLCKALAPQLHAMRIGRVIARPFVGSEAEGWTRTANRRDFAMAPPEPTLCDVLAEAGRPVHAVGKIGDIFSMRGIADATKGTDAALADDLLRRAGEAADGSLTFANFVEFDSAFGHRRDVSGYARHLEWFDRVLVRVIPRLRQGDLLVVTADHGNDPTWHGTDHTRERVPVLMHGAGARELGLMDFVDVGATVATHLGLTMKRGRSVL